ncbi:DUF4430 domain-containing protein [Blautia hansenii]|uniref:DUF4430 domain-containing protein n=1 Tax=Blautia hansenii TaxID=1322 RepID=UPI0032C0A00A
MKQKRYSFGKQLLSMLLVMVLLLSGITVPVKADNSQKEQVNAKEQPYVYFQYDDGRIQEMGEDNTFTLNLLDTGNFVLAGTDKRPDWNFSARVQVSDTEHQKHYWVNSKGRYVPFDVRKVEGYVCNADNPGEVFQTFSIDNVSSEIEEVKAFIGNQEVSLDKPYQVEGTASGNVSIKGRVKGEEEFKTIPVEAPDNESGHVVISVERFTIGQGYIYEPVFVPFEKGDNAATLLKKVIGKENFVGEDTYLEAIVGGDLGTDKVVVPEYIEKLSNGSVTTETAREWGNEDNGDGGDALGEFDYSNYSGWMYHVNGEEVGYGIASYKPKDGDVLRFQFTMYGYGTDLTGRQWGNPNPIIDICNKDEITKLMAEVNADREKKMAVPEVKAAYDEAVKLVSAVITPKEEIDAAAAKLREAVENAQKVPNGWLETSEGWQYYENGQKVIGWLDTGNHWYYMDHNGIMVTGWVSVNGHWYYMDQWGAMVTGWVSVNGRWYYMDQWGAMMTGWVSVNGHWYYLNTDGSMAASQWIGDYYVQADGAMATSQWIGGYYVDTFGKWVRNA